MNQPNPQEERGRKDLDIQGYFRSRHPAKTIDYSSYNENMILECSFCDWKGTPEGHIEYYDGLFDVSCPNCDKMLLIVTYS